MRSTEELAVGGASCQTGRAFFFGNHFRGSKVDISCAHAHKFELCTGGRCLRALLIEKNVRAEE